MLPSNYPYHVLSPGADHLVYCMANASAIINPLSQPVFANNLNPGAVTCLQPVQSANQMSDQSALMSQSTMRPGHPGIETQQAAQFTAGLKRLLNEMKMRQFDSIRFAAYRTACKLRYIQQRTLFCFVELWRVVETFRDFGLNQVTESNASLDYSSTRRLLSCVYNQITVPASLVQSATQAPTLLAQNLLTVASELMMCWLVHALDICATGRLMVNSLKVALSTLANAKPTEKFRYHFTFLSDPSGALIPSKFDLYLKDLLRLPISVFEGPNFSYTQQAVQSIISGKSKNILVEEFLERMCAEPGSKLLVWLTIFHRLASVEGVRHSVRCEGCKREPIHGLRYKCTRCAHYNLCQDCFWTGVTTEQHTNAHDVKEYSSASKSHSRQFGHSLRKSFQLSKLTGGTPREIKPSSTEKFPASGESRRPPLNAIIEWNSAPANVNLTENNSAHAMNNALTDLGMFNQTRIPTVNTNAMRTPLLNTIRSPVPHRRLQQLNPLFLSSPINQRPRGISQDITSFNQANPSMVQTVHDIPTSPGYQMTAKNAVGETNQEPPWREVPELNQHSQQQTRIGPHSSNSTDPGRFRRHVDTKCKEEHQLIAKYAAQLAAVSAFSSDLKKFENLTDCPQTQKQLIAELQLKNRKILKEIEKLRTEQQKQAAVIAAASSSSDSVRLQQQLATLSPRASAQPISIDDEGVLTGQTGCENPKVFSELQHLRQRRDNLESRMNNLQRNRAELTVQLETLIRLLSVSSTNQASGNQPTSGSSGRHELNVFSPQLTQSHQPRSTTTRAPSQPPPRRSSSLSYNCEQIPKWSTTAVSTNQTSGERNDALLQPGQNDLDLTSQDLLSPLQDLIRETSLIYGSNKPSFGTLSEQTPFESQLSTKPSMLNADLFSGTRRLVYASPRKLSAPNGRTGVSSTQPDSGSEANIYSDPELCGMGPYSSLSRGIARKLVSKLSDISFAGASVRDNYEYSTAIRAAHARKSRTLESERLD